MSSTRRHFLKSSALLTAGWLSTPSVTFADG